MSLHDSFLGIILLSVGLFGCASTSDVPKVGFHTNEEAVSFRHPVEYARDQKEVTRLSAILAPELLTELDVEAGAIVWPIIAKQPGKPIVKGFSFIVGMNSWGDIVLEALLPLGGSDAKQSRFLIVNRDGGWAYTLGGTEVNYDSKRFESDVAYQEEVFASVGMSGEELSASWNRYFSARGIQGRIVPFETIIVGSEAWNAYANSLAEGMKANKMPNGEIRLGTVTTEELQKQAASKPGSTYGQRFGRNLSIGIDPISVAIGMANAGVSAAFEPLKGYYAKAEGIRRDQVSTYRWLVKSYQQLLAGQRNHPVEK